MLLLRAAFHYQHTCDAVAVVLMWRRIASSHVAAVLRAIGTQRRWWCSCSGNRAMHVYIYIYINKLLIHIYLYISYIYMIAIRW